MFLLNFVAFFQQSASLLYYALVDELHDNFETINAGKQELNSLNFVHDSRFAYEQLPHELSRF